MTMRAVPHILTLLPRSKQSRTSSSNSSAYHSYLSTPSTANSRLTVPEYYGTMTDYTHHR